MSGLTGCGGGPLASTRLAVTTNVHVESMPAEADVFNVDERGNVDKHIGKTPLTIPVQAVAFSDSDGTCSGKFSAWAPAGYWSGSGRGTASVYKVSLYVTKEGYYDAYVSTIFEYRCDVEKPEDRHINVRLDVVKPDDKPVQVLSP